MCGNRTIMAHNVSKSLIPIAKGGGEKFCDHGSRTLSLDEVTVLAMQ